MVLDAFSLTISIYKDIIIVQTSGFTSIHNYVVKIAIEEISNTFFSEFRAQHVLLHTLWTISNTNFFSNQMFERSCSFNIFFLFKMVSNYSKRIEKKNSEKSLFEKLFVATSVTLTNFV